MSRSYTYDVAFSFLSQDEPLALQLNDRLADRVKTFIYTEQQKAIAGTDGGDSFARVFGEEARMVVVLYRGGWGEKGWTNIEQTAIRNRAHEETYEFCKFIPLDDPPTVPRWVPKNHLWIGLKRFGIEGAAAVIEARIAELGGAPHEESVSDRAARLARNMAFEERRKRFQWDGVQAAQAEVGKLREYLKSFAAKVSNETPTVRLQLLNYSPWESYLIGLGRALGAKWTQPYGNTLSKAFLDVQLFSDRPLRPGEFRFDEISTIRTMRFVFDLLPSETGVWILEKKRTFSTEALAEFLTKFYLDNGRNKE